MDTLSGTDRLRHWLPKLVVISCCSSGHALPAPGSDGIQRTTVRFADLNLSKPEDVAELYRRIEYAARKVCVEHVRGWDECFRNAVAMAVARIDDPGLNALYRHKTATENANAKRVSV